MTTRREFIGHAGIAAGAAALGLGSTQPAAAQPGLGGRGRDPHRPRQQGMTILILGGTGFIGPHVVRLSLIHF